MSRGTSHLHTAALERLPSPSRLGEAPLHRGDGERKLQEAAVQIDAAQRPTCLNAGLCVVQTLCKAEQTVSIS